MAGLALSFSLFTLLGAGLVWPRLQQVLERPFAAIPQRGVSADRNGFLLGLALGAVYVPCAGPVLAAITVVVMVGLAVALTFNVTDAVQRAIPDYTTGLNDALNSAGNVSRALAPADHAGPPCRATIPGSAAHCRGC